MENKYLISQEKDERFDNYIELLDGDYFCHNYNLRNIRYKSSDGFFMLIAGDFINAKKPNQNLEELTNKLIKYRDIKSIIEKTNFLAGRFIIFLGDSDGLKYALSDPITTIPINYTFVNNKYIIASHSHFIADKLGYEPSEEALNIKKGSSEQQQPLPYNLTMYDEIKILIPNHFLDIQAKKAVRFFPTTPIKRVSFDEAVETTIKLSKNIIDGYFNTRKISLPITAGIDSRTVLALMRDHIQKVEMYTFFHERFTDETADIKIPIELSKKFDLSYQKLPTKIVPDEKQRKIADELNGLEIPYVLNNAYTYSESSLSDYASVPGDIISLTKSPFGKNLPENFATLSYFMTKTHNYSEEIKKYIKMWMDDTKEYSETNDVSLYDLYNLEYRLGRWMPTGIQNYDYFTERIYIFNCRYLVELWMSISKKERTEKSFHLEMIKRLWPELLEVEINPDEKIVDKLLSNSYLFYIGSFIKYELKRFL